MMRRTVYIIILSLGLLYSCTDRKERSAGTNTTCLAYDRAEIKFASGFSIKDYGDHKILEVYNPWQGAEGISYSYLLARDLTSVDKSLLKEHTVVEIPVIRTVCTSTTHIAFLESLGRTKSIVGISGSGLVNNEEIKEGLEQGKIIDIGYEQSMNLESLVIQKPDMIMMYGIESEITAFINKISDLDIPVVMNGDYLEHNPLGKLEWIKFVAAFYDMEEKAAEYFDSVAGQYNNLKLLAGELSSKPSVMEGLPWKDVWYVSAGNTVLSNYIKDAGGLYVWESLRSEKALPMDIESVYKKAANADVWINPGTAGSITDILDNDSRHKNFLPVKSSRVYNNNKRMGESGGNDYWESGVTNPQLVLRDLINIFHPGVLGDSSLVYYKKL